MKIELTIIADIDEKTSKNISLDEFLEGIVIRNSDVVDEFELTTLLNNDNNSIDSFLRNAKIAKRKLIKEQYYFLVHRKCSDTWHIGYVGDSDAGMIGMFPTNIPETYKSKTDAVNTIRRLVGDSYDKKYLDIVYEIDKLFYKSDAIALVEQTLQDGFKENRSENKPG